jgi:hypothetical protein
VWNWGTLGGRNFTNLDPQFDRKPRIWTKSQGASWPGLRSHSYLLIPPLTWDIGLQGSMKSDSGPTDTLTLELRCMPLAAIRTFGLLHRRLILIYVLTGLSIFPPIFPCNFLYSRYKTCYIETRSKPIEMYNAHRPNRHTPLNNKTLI